jgi:deoxyribodipyrimidine photolyase-related protein
LIVNNYFGNRKKLNKNWYEWNTGIKPIDDCIIDGFNTGYLHHIERLMFVGNFMNFMVYHPKEGFKWFMEFSTDSYEWVMCQNVLDMVFFCTGGKTMRKPYATSSNYILKMSSYKYSENKDWVDKWNNLYTNFMKKNKNKLWKFRYHFPTLSKL